MNRAVSALHSRDRLRFPAGMHRPHALLGTLLLIAASLLAEEEKGPPSEKNPEVRKYEELAAKGDAPAMVELGVIYHTARGVKQDYGAAFDWYLKAIEKNDGDAVNNIGVLFRDGLGVPKNEKLAYVLFLAVHMEGLGTDDTQIRAGRNLQRLVDTLPKEQICEALSYTWPYVVQLLKSRGKNVAAGADVLPARDRPRIRDNHWWTDRERAGMTFESPPPWDKKG